MIDVCGRITEAKIDSTFHMVPSEATPSSWRPCLLGRVYSGA